MQTNRSTRSTGIFSSITALGLSLTMLAFSAPSAAFANLDEGQTEMLSNTRTAEAGRDSDDDGISERTISLRHARIVKIPEGYTHLALHWPHDELADDEHGDEHGDEDEQGEQSGLTVAFRDSGGQFGEVTPVLLDEVGAEGEDRLYSIVMAFGQASHMRLTSNDPLTDLTIVFIDGSGPELTEPSSVLASGSSFSSSAGGARIAQPMIVSRADWGANESLRFDEEGNEKWKPYFRPVQKLVVHHTATSDGGDDPASAIRAVYRYQAIGRGWGDIGYNFLIDKFGRIYEGRYSRPYDPGEIPTGENEELQHVVGAHVAYHNSGTIGVALLGGMTEHDATPAAREALVSLLAWKAERHDIDPLGEGTYTSPDNGIVKHLPNIAGHRNLAATACPGKAFYPTLPAIRQAVADRLAVAVPGEPALRARTARKPGVRLDWSAPSSDGGAMITSYRIMRWNSSTKSYVSIATVSGSARRYRDANTRSGVRYSYVIHAVNAIGVGPQSAAASAVAR